MSPVPSNEVYYRRYLDDPIITNPPQYANPTPAPSLVGPVQVETAQGNLTIHQSAAAQQNAFMQQFNTTLGKVI